MSGHFGAVSCKYGMFRLYSHYDRMSMVLALWSDQAAVTIFKLEVDFTFKRGLAIALTAEQV